MCRSNADAVGGNHRNHRNGRRIYLAIVEGDEGNRLVFLSK